jgi:hypothetical protein
MGRLGRCFAARYRLGGGGGDRLALMNRNLALIATIARGHPRTGHMPMAPAATRDFVLAATRIVPLRGESLERNGLGEQKCHKREREPAGCARGHYA